ncbi:hypothetical protein Talka_02135 [Tepidimonas alkaliphilus]|uniref:CobQ/CobB/MinD/ParA nucleotide binding domain protein n=1 Tax=Tepidimonas alkaliphilus TaxID=2588942 RepID=A0A554W4J0_9BURK|nr:hypothetical protein [Tepidimonas alkaliphilus]TSE18492.1 hypothetical protein Talka_02135 [Tepidimonas alkaliphilus]
MKAIIFSHGEKGGVGKSTVASVLVDALSFGARKRVMLIEGDVKIDDVYNRYHRHVVKAAQFNLADQTHYEDAVSKMLEYLEHNMECIDVAVVNLPATATGTIDRDVETLGEAVSGLGADLRVIYSASSNPSGMATVAESFKNGLASYAEKTMLLAQEFLDDGNSNLVERLKTICPEVAIFPKLASYTYSAVMEKPDVPLSLLCTKGHPQALETFI